MNSAFPGRSSRIRRVLVATAGISTAALVLAGCASGGSGSGPSGSTGGGGSIIVGTTDKVTFIDPAGSYDQGSFSIMNQVFPFLLNSKPGTADVEPDIAQSAQFTTPTEYTVKLKPGLKFANGHNLTSSDVKFSFDRQLKIADKNGPSVLLYNLSDVKAVDDTTILFTLKTANDQIWPQILSSPAAPIVDEEVFSPSAITPDADIVKANAFAGPYVITNYNLNSLVTFKANDAYKGLLSTATSDVTLKYYTASSNLKLDVQEGNIDVAYRSLTPTDIADLKGNQAVKVAVGPGGEIRYVVFNFDTMPFGAKTPESNPAKALAVRQAVADSVDRNELSSQVYKGTYLPLYSYVAAGLTGANEALKGLYGDGKGAPDKAKAAARLTAAGVQTPVTLNLQYNPDHYGQSSGDEYALVKSQLEATGLFKVNLQSTEWVQYSKDRVADVYPLYQLGWFPDYSDADNYLTPFFHPSKDKSGNVVLGGFLANHYNNDQVNALIEKQATEPDAAARVSEIGKIQDLVAADLSTVPLLQGAQIAVTGKSVSGATLDGSFKFRFGTLSKG